ncbi:MAG: hypothetical protein ACR2KQ_03790 [Actinomycetota bacterium]
MTEHRGRKIRTVELLRLQKPDVIRYEWLEGPLDEVREAILFQTLSPAATLVRYEGEFSFRKGVLGWVIGRLMVKPAFDRVVHEHLLGAKKIAERRAARSRLYPQPTLGGSDDA